MLAKKALLAHRKRLKVVNAPLEAAVGVQE
jgi:hypothetical protein